MRDYKKNIITKDAKHNKATFINKDAVKDVKEGKSPSALREEVKSTEPKGKGMTTTDISAFIGAGAGIDIREAFKDRPNIVKALKEARLTYTNQVPRTVKLLTSIKGIGNKSAQHILETLS